MMANKALGDPIGLNKKDEEEGGILTQYSYNATSAALLFSTFFILFGIALTGMASKCGETAGTTATISMHMLAAVVGGICGFLSTDYPTGNKTGRGFMMMIMFGFIPLAIQAFMFMKSKSRVGNKVFGTYAMFGLFGQSAARLSIDLQDLEGDQIDLGYYATTLALAGLSFLLSLGSAFTKTEKCSGSKPSPGLASMKPKLERQQSVLPAIPGEIKLGKVDKNMAEKTEGFVPGL